MSHIASNFLTPTVLIIIIIVISCKIHIHIYLFVYDKCLYKVPKAWFQRIIFSRSVIDKLYKVKNKGKVIPLQARFGPEGECRCSSILP